VDNSEYLVEREKKTPVTEKKDVIAVGGGLTGVVAAVAAARNGKSVLLIESKSCFGGVATMGLPIQGYIDCNHDRIVSGIAEEFRNRLIARGGALPEFIECDMHNPYLILDPESVKIVCQQMLEDAGVKVLLHTMVVDVDCSADKIHALMIEGKSGREAVLAKTFIDSTGDADIAARCNAPYVIGREVDGETQAATLNFRLDNIDLLAFKRAILENPDRYDMADLLSRKQFRSSKKHIMVGLEKVIREARKEGFEDFPWGNLCYITTLDENSVYMNTVHVKGYLACDTRGLTNIELECRKQVDPVIRFLRSYAPGFENATLTSTAGWSGIRETRRIKGQYTMTVDDLRAGRRFEDTIALGGYPIDIHSPDGLIFEKVPSYGIPYRAMLPQGVDNLIVAGRSISATHEAMGSIRNMAHCMAMGQASGVAASLATSDDSNFSKVDIVELQRMLREQGACL
jgi:hypothetical protein